MRVIYTASLVAAGLFVLVGFQNCGKSEVGFAEGENSSSSFGGNDPYEVVTKTFSVDTRAQDIDVVWTFDNSGSMGQEAAHMAANFQAFANMVKTQFNVRIALINRVKSAAYKTNNVALPSGLGPENVSVDYFVDSYNGMLLAGASTCPKPAAADDEFCQKINSTPRFQRIQGSLSSFFRQNSKKVFVFVTDDDSSGPKGGPQWDQYPALAGLREGSSIPLIENEHYIREATFRDRMERAFGAQSDFKVFGFVSLDKKVLSPCAARESAEYKSLITQTGGEFFNICDADWTGHFLKLTDSIISFAKNEFNLENSRYFKAIRKVSVNGTVISDTSFKIANGKVILDSAILQDLGSYRIDVEFEKWSHISSSP